MLKENDEQHKFLPKTRGVQKESTQFSVTTVGSRMYLLIVNEVS